MANVHDYGRIYRSYGTAAKTAACRIHLRRGARHAQTPAMRKDKKSCIYRTKVLSIYCRKISVVCYNEHVCETLLSPCCFAAWFFYKSDFPIKEFYAPVSLLPPGRHVDDRCRSKLAGL